MSASMQADFVDFLTSRGVMTGPGVANVRQLARQREPLGTIAFRYGLLSGEAIDQILDEQRRQSRPFGEIAKQWRLLTQAQLDALLRVQELRGVIETAEVLVLTGVCSFDDMLGEVVQYLPHLTDQAENPRLAPRS